MTECKKPHYIRKAISHALMALVISAVMIIAVIFIIPLEIAWWNDNSITKSLSSDQLAYWHNVALYSLVGIGAMISLFKGYHAFKKGKSKCSVCSQGVKVSQN